MTTSTHIMCVDVKNLLNILIMSCNSAVDEIKRLRRNDGVKQVVFYNWFKKLMKKLHRKGARFYNFNKYRLKLLYIHYDIFYLGITARLDFIIYMIKHNDFTLTYDKFISKKNKYIAFNRIVPIDLLSVVEINVTYGSTEKNNKKNDTKNVINLFDLIVNDNKSLQKNTVDRINNNLTFLNDIYVHNDVINITSDDIAANTTVDEIYDGPVLYTQDSTYVERDEFLYTNDNTPVAKYRNSNSPRAFFVDDNKNDEGVFIELAVANVA